MMRSRNGGMQWLGGLTVLVLFVSACGDDGVDDDGASGSTSPSISGVDEEELLDDPAGAAGDLADSLEDLQGSQGGGSASLVVGDQAWEFTSVLCAFGPDEIGQEGAEFVLSSLQDGMQLYASIDTFGHVVSLNDIEDFENPTVDLSSAGDGLIEIDGRSASATMEFRDGTSDDPFATVPGEFQATCP